LNEASGNFRFMAPKIQKAPEKAPSAKTNYENPMP
jgi:hypothetical protein